MNVKSDHVNVKSDHVNVKSDHLKFDFAFNKELVQNFIDPWSMWFMPQFADPGFVDGVDIFRSAFAARYVAEGDKNFLPWIMKDVFVYTKEMWEIVQLGKIGYEAFPEKVRSSNDFNYRVRVGPFENRSAMNNAREDFRRLNMDSMEIKYCKKISDDSD